MYECLYLSTVAVLRRKVVWGLISMCGVSREDIYFSFLKQNGWNSIRAFINFFLFKGITYIFGLHGDMVKEATHSYNGRTGGRTMGEQVGEPWENQSAPIWENVGALVLPMFSHQYWYPDPSSSLSQTTIKV